MWDIYLQFLLFDCSDFSGIETIHTDLCFRKTEMRSILNKGFAKLLVESKDYQARLDEVSKHIYLKPMFIKANWWMIL